MKIIGNNPAADNAEITAVASGTLPSGQPVVVNADGTVSVVAEATVNTPSLATRYSYGGTPLYNAAVYDSNSNKVVIVYEDRDLSTEGTAIVGTVSGEVITFGTPVSFSSGGVRDVGATFDSTNNKVIIAYNDSSNSSYGTAVVGTVSGTSISFGSNLVFESNATYNIHLAYDSNSDDVVIAYRANIASNQGKCAICSVSGTSLLRSDTVTFTNKISTVTYDMDIGFDSNLNKFLIVYKDEDNLAYGTAIVGTISGGSTLSLGTPVVFNAGETSRINLSFDTNENRFLLIYNDVSDNSYGKARVATISGSSVSFGTEVTFFSDLVSDLASSYDPVENKTLVIIDYSTAAGKIATATISGTSVTFGTLGDLADLDSQLGSVYDSNAGKIVFCGLNSQSNGVAAVGKFTSTGSNLTSENYIGMSGGVVNSETVTQALGSDVVFNAASSTFTATTYDENAQKVVISYRDGGNSNYGTAVVGTVSGTSISFGTPVVFESAATARISTTYDSNAQKVVVVYQDQGNSNRGTAAIGTVSGTSISFGTPVVFESGDTRDTTCVYHAAEQKVVIAYKDQGNSSYGTAIVGTVSGTSISFGGASIFNAAESQYNSLSYDSANEKVVISYTDSGNSNYGTAIVGTVSGTSISFGSESVFESASTTSISSAYDVESGTIVVSYTDAGNSSYGTAIVGTVSGTGISFGTPVVFENASTGSKFAAYDSAAKKVVIAYQDIGNTYNGTFITGTVSGTSISFASPVVFDTGFASDISASYDSNSQKVVVGYVDYDNSIYGTSVVFQPAYTSVTRGQVADGDKATIDIGCAISTNQLGLTAGQQYFVQTDGTLGLTAADPSVIAGTAISATEIIVKG